MWFDIAIYQLCQTGYWLYRHRWYYAGIGSDETIRRMKRKFNASSSSSAELEKGLSDQQVAVLVGVGLVAVVIVAVVLVNSNSRSGPESSPNPFRSLDFSWLSNDITDNDIVNGLSGDDKAIAMLRLYEVEMDSWISSATVALDNYLDAPNECATASLNFLNSQPKNTCRKRNLFGKCVKWDYSDFAYRESEEIGQECVQARKEALLEISEARPILPGAAVTIINNYDPNTLSLVTQRGEVTYGQITNALL